MAADLPAPVHRPPCTCIATDQTVDLACVCGDVERCLRGWVAKYPMPAMTAEQRAWCADEVERQGDSTDQPGRLELLQMGDASLADAVLRGWQDYARDKGMIP